MGDMTVAQVEREIARRISTIPFEGGDPPDWAELYWQAAKDILKIGGIRGLLKLRDEKRLAGWLDEGCDSKEHDAFSVRIRCDCGECIDNMRGSLREGKAPTPSGQWPEGE